MKDVKIDDELHKRLKIAAVEQGKKLGAYVSKVLEMHLAKRGKNK